MAATREGRGKRHFLEENDIFSRKTTSARLVLGGEALRVAHRAVMVWCPRHLREQSPFFLLAQKKAQKSLNIVPLPFKTAFRKKKKLFSVHQTKTGKEWWRNISPSQGLHQSDWWGPWEGETFLHHAFPIFVWCSGKRKRSDKPPKTPQLLPSS